MDTSLAERVEDWHDFDVLVGTAAATLVDIIFVAASIDRRERLHREGSRGVEGFQRRFEVIVATALEKIP
jgi:hypothetical protein